MTLRDHDRLESLMAYKPLASKPAILFNASEGIHPVFCNPFGKWPLRSLRDDEIVCPGDVIEDIEGGDRVAVKEGGFYDGVIGYKVKQVKELDRVFDVLRPE